VAGQPVWPLLDDRGAVPVPAVVHVGAVARGDVPCPHLDVVLGEQVPQHAAGLTAERAAQRDGRAERGDHPRLPEPLPARVQVHVGLSVEILHGHRQLRRRREHTHPFSHKGDIPTRA
jgi:hypothetical protein